MSPGHRQDVAQAATGQFGAQLRVLAVDLVAGDPCRGSLGVEGIGDHCPGQRRLGGEHGAIGDPGGLAPGQITGPGPGQVQSPVNERRPGRGGIGQVHRDLSVLGPPGRAGVLPLSAHSGGALLQVTGLDQDRIGVGEVLQYVIAQVMSNCQYLWIGVSRRGLD